MFGESFLDTFSTTLDLQTKLPGMHKITAVAIDTSGLTDSTGFYLMVHEYPLVNQRPSGIDDGINYNPEGTVSLSLFAPHKDFVYVIGDFNDSLIDDENVQISIAMPGIKTLNKRGIELMANGPRIPNLCDEIEKRLTLKNKILQIENDSDMCAWGEEFGKNGAFRNIENAYYIGGGTGTADGLKLEGKLISFDDASEWIAKAWELMTDDKTSLELFSSMSGIKKLRQLKSDKEIGLILGQLIIERINTIFFGWNDEFIVNRYIENSHPYKKTLLDKIVIGQRLSEFLQSEKGTVVFSQIIETLTNNCLKSQAKIKNHFINNKVFDKDRIILSNLRSAPIIGLAAKSFFYNVSPR